MRRITLASLVCLSSLLLCVPLVVAQNKSLPATQPAEPTQSQEVPCIPKGVDSVALSPNGRLVLTGGHGWGVRLFELATGKELHHFRGHENEYVHLAFAPDGHSALVYSFSTSMHLLDVESGQEIRRLNAPKSGTESAFFAADGRAIVVADDNEETVRVVNVASGLELRSFKVSESNRHISRLNISPSGRYALAQTFDGMACLWDVETGRKARCFQFDKDDVGFDLFGRYAVYLSEQTGALRFLDVERAEELPLSSIRISGRKFIEGLTTDGSLALIYTDDESQMRRLLDLRSGREFAPLEIDKDEKVSAFTFTSDGLHAIAGSGDDAFCVWDLKSGKRLRCFKAESK